MNACITGRSTFSRNELLAKAAAVDAKVAAGEPLAPLEGLPVVVRAPGRKALLYWERRQISAPLRGETQYRCGRGEVHRVHRRPEEPPHPGARSRSARGSEESIYARSEKKEPCLNLLLPVEIRRVHEFCGGLRSDDKRPGVAAPRGGRRAAGREDQHAGARGVPLRLQPAPRALQQPARPRLRHWRELLGDRRGHRRRLRSSRVPPCSFLKLPRYVWKDKVGT